MQETLDSPPLRHDDPLTAQRIETSMRAVHGGVLTTTQFHRWLAGRRQAQQQYVRPVPLGRMRAWRFDPGTGNLGHDSGRFFTVEGLHVRTDFGPTAEWSQPIINQPEIGVLGIAMREFDGVLHCLMQAKCEPGNINGVQLSPTVQATKSNYTRVHGGADVAYLDLFRDLEPHRVIADVLQSEQGAWFYRKRNRNMVVEVGADVEADPDFCWLTLGQLFELMRLDNLVGMDARTVLSCIPFAGPQTSSAGEDFAAVLARSRDEAAGGLHTMTEVLSWITSMQAQHELSAQRIPLRTVQHWNRSEYAISHDEGLYFDIIGVDVESNSREVGSWQQPLVAPHGIGIAALLVRRFGGVLHALVSARVEPGYLGAVELAPTVQCTLENHAHRPAENLPPFLDIVLARRSRQVRFDTELSEEGGRFYRARTRYVIVELDQDEQVGTPPGFQWLTLHQLSALLRHSHYLNVQARTLFACLLGAR